MKTWDLSLLFTAVSSAPTINAIEGHDKEWEGGQRKAYTGIEIGQRK